MLPRFRNVLVVSLFLAASAQAQEVLPMPPEPASCSAGKVSTDMTLFLGPEDEVATPLRVVAGAEDKAGAIVGSLPDRGDKPTRRMHPTAE